MMAITVPMQSLYLNHGVLPFQGRFLPRNNDRSAAKGAVTMRVECGSKYDPLAYAGLGSGRVGSGPKAFGSGRVRKFRPDSTSSVEADTWRFVRLFRRQGRRFPIIYIDSQQ